MKTAKFKSRSMQKVYEACLALAQDKSSEMYLKNGGQHRGANHRCAFWDGFNGLKRSANVLPGTLTEAAFMAGKAYAKQCHEAKSSSELVEKSQIRLNQPLHLDAVDLAAGDVGTVLAVHPEFRAYTVQFAAGHARPGLVVLSQSQITQATAAT